MDAETARYCIDQVRKFDHDRYLCTLFVPEAVRDHVFALYAFNVEVARVREMIREPMMGRIRLQWWREVVEDAPRGNIRRHPVGMALAETVQSFRLQAGPFDRLLSARELDLGEEPPADLAALEAYAADTSSTLIELVLAIIGVQEEAAQEAGRHVGIAWALTGLLRAVPFHAAQRRMYLPATMLREAGVRLDRVYEGRAGAELAEVARAVAERARWHLGQARVMRANVPRRAVPALLPAVLADLYLGRLARTGFSLFDPRLQKPAGERALRLAWAAWRSRY